jgi:hypothetical protein
MRDAALAADAHALADDRDARLVVAAEDRAAVAPHDVVLDDRPDALARAHRVHVRAEEEGRRVGGAGDVGDQVADLARDLRARVVEGHGGAEAFELAREALRDAALALRQAVDPDELEEESEEAVALDHGATEPSTAPSTCRAPVPDVSCRACGTASRFSSPAPARSARSSADSSRRPAGR